MNLKNSLEISTWKAVKGTIKNSDLVSEINQINNADDFRVVIARYRFGDPVIDKGQFNVRIDDRIVPFFSGDTPKEILEMMDYKWSAIPVGVVRKNSMESHINHSTHIIPFALQKPGHVFSALSLFNEEPFSNLIPEMRSTRAGCRSLLLLSRLTLEAGNKNLQKRYQLQDNLHPKSYSEHWGLFNEIISSKEFESDWDCEIVLFSKDFLYPERERLGIRHYLLQSIWRLFSFRREEMVFNLIWSDFEKDLPLPMKNPIFFTETTKHIIKIALQESPAYSPAFSEVSGPIHALSDVFANDYKLQDGFPVFMCLDKYDLENPIYYSLQKHNFSRAMPKKIANAGKIVEISGVKKVFDAFRKYILEDHCKHPLQKSLLYNMLKNTEFTFYHPQAEEDGIAKDIEKLAQEDPRFFEIYNKGTYKKHLPFPQTAVFFHGCVRIKSKNIKSHSTL